MGRRLTLIPFGSEILEADRLGIPVQTYIGALQDLVDAGLSPPDYVFVEFGEDRNWVVLHTDLWEEITRRMEGGA